MDAVSPQLREKLDALVTHPGVYLYRNADGEVIYIGKAKSLRQRVRSYFQPSAQHPPRIARMVREVRDLEVIVVDTEMEALILESNLVKRERPRYNVVLRDDKHFPYLKLSLEDEYARVSLVRKAKLDGNVYVGPFLPASKARRSMKLVQRYFGVPTCKEVFDAKRRPCLYFHLDQCLAPCARVPERKEYDAAVTDARMFLEGRHKDLEASLERRMREASQALEFERAARHRDALRTVQSLAVRQRMSSVGLEQQDYLAHHGDGAQVVLQLFQMRQGKVQSRREFALEQEDVEPADLYASVLVQIYEEITPPPEIYLPAEPAESELIQAWLSERRGAKVQLRQPQRGSKKRFLELVTRNAQVAFENRFRAHHRQGVQALETLAEALGLDEPPLRIECFDISNTQGSDSVASMVVFEQGKPRKSDYRSYNIKSVEGADDFASIGEAVLRRYRRLLAEDRRLPDLVVIDGGEGQLGAAVGSLAQAGLPTLPVISLAKREEEIYRPGQEAPLRLDRRSPALQLLQRLRDEAHRFAVGTHRKRRTRRIVKTELTEVPGIGPTLARRLLTRFGSLDGVRQAGSEAWRRVAGRRAAEALLQHFESSGSSREQSPAATPPPAAAPASSPSRSDSVELRDGADDLGTGRGEGR